mmetsp:Transcript_6251/g.14956  ORF Transcript_6251/g.14956 Transcript_6251/m.14956 type:complete len:231 (-) Transcript_6251:396-1088(-)
MVDGYCLKFAKHLSQGEFNKLSLAILRLVAPDRGEIGQPEILNASSRWRALTLPTNRNVGGPSPLARSMRTHGHKALKRRCIGWAPSLHTWTRNNWPHWQIWCLASQPNRCSRLLCYASGYILLGSITRAGSHKSSLRRDGWLSPRPVARNLPRICSRAVSLQKASKKFVVPVVFYQRSKVNVEAWFSVFIRMQLVCRLVVNRGLIGIAWQRLCPSNLLLVVHALQQQGL